METIIESFDFYSEELNGNYIPDVTLISVKGDDRDMSVDFFWRNTRQSLTMSKDNAYGDNYWLIMETNYTEDFEDYLDEELDNYDSLEAMFENLQPLTKYHFVVGKG